MTAPHQKQSAAPDTEGKGPQAGDPRENTAASDPSSDSLPLDDRITKLEAERDDLKATLVRRQADFENFRKRTERERHEESRRTMGHFIQHLLPVLDGFERALAVHDNPAYEDYRKGFELIYRQLWEALAKQGLERIEAAGKLFDPHVHMAIERVETLDHEDGFVIEVLQPGYVFHGRVLRPATVRVAAAPADASNKSQN
ncbi:MAG TPA: nucleotide exchange factor GrpE [Candidatus Acidoferrales bacterium]|nr:nucleotide exchange factor GrpE [Candidatus Acidoferrales bacterium]